MRDQNCGIVDTKLLFVRIGDGNANVMIEIQELWMFNWTRLGGDPPPRRRGGVGTMGELMNSVNRLTRKAVAYIVGRTESSLIHGRKPDCIPLLEFGI